MGREDTLSMGTTRTVWRATALLVTAVALTHLDGGSFPPRSDGRAVEVAGISVQRAMRDAERSAGAASTRAGSGASAAEGPAQASVASPTAPTATAAPAPTPEPTVTTAPAPVTTVTTTPPPSTAPVSEPAADTAGQGDLRERVLAAIDFPIEQRLPGWRIEFLGERRGYQGLTYSQERLIRVYVRDDFTFEHLVHVTAHELGHAIDIDLLTAEDHARWNEARGRGADATWWAASGAEDYSSGAGDWAESFRRHLRRRRGDPVPGP